MCSKFKEALDNTIYFNDQSKEWLINQNEIQYCPFCGSIVTEDGCSSKKESITINECLPEVHRFPDQVEKISEEYKELLEEVEEFNLESLVVEGLDLMTATWGLVLIAIRHIAIRNEESQAKVKVRIESDYKVKIEGKKRGFRNDKVV